MSFSPKQKQILTFPYESDYDALICDGAVRSGKTSIMSLSFVLCRIQPLLLCFLRQERGRGGT